MSTSLLSSQVETLKTRLKHIWMAGDYDRFSRYMEGDAREFYERLNLAPGSQLLDVGCGSGQLALMAAKDGLEVTGVDIASNLVERARARTAAEGLQVRFEEADAEALPYEHETFAWWQASSEQCLRHDRTWWLKNYCVCAGQGERLPWPVGRRRGSSPDVQDRIDIHCAVRDAFAGSVGR